jgi:hypothetical protein
MGAQRNMPRIINSPKHWNNPKHWRDRAAAMRALADTIKDAETTAIMRKLADDYDKLADRALQCQKTPKKS